MKNFLFLLLSVFIILSCSDSRSEIALEDFHPVVSNPTKVLTKLKVIEVGSPAYEVNYNYTSGKLTSVIASNGSYSYNLQYTGNELSQVVQTLGQGQQLVTRISSLIYTNKQLTSITGTETSVASGASSFLTSISYIGDNPSNITRTFTKNGSTTVSQNVNLAYTNNNLTGVNYFYGPVNNQSNIVLSLSNYDLKQNPLNTIPTAFTISSSFVNEDPFSIFGLSLNNYRTSTKAFLGGSTQENTVFTYSEDGFPTKSVSSNLILDYEYIIF